MSGLLSIVLSVNLVGFQKSFACLKNAFPSSPSNEFHSLATMFSNTTYTADSLLQCINTGKTWRMGYACALFSTHKIVFTDKLLMRK